MVTAKVSNCAFEKKLFSSNLEFMATSNWKNLLGNLCVDFRTFQLTTRLFYLLVLFKILNTKFDSFRGTKLGKIGDTCLHCA